MRSPTGAGPVATSPHGRPSIEHLAFTLLVKRVALLVELTATYMALTDVPVVQAKELGSAKLDGGVDARMKNL